MLGPSFIKLGQVLASRPDIVREDYMNELCVLQDDVPPFPDSIVRPQHLLHTHCSGPLCRCTGGWAVGGQAMDPTSLKHKHTAEQHRELQLLT